MSSTEPQDSPAPPPATAATETSARSSSGAEAPASHAGHARAKSLLKQGRVALAKGDHETARQRCHDGIAALGDDYAPEGTEDDTSLKIAAADDLWKRGRHEDAADTCLRMLAIRITLYNQRYPGAPKDGIAE